MSCAMAFTCATADHAAGLGQALKRVAEGSFGAMLAPVPPDAWPEDCASRADWVEASVTFTGPLAGVLACRMPRLVARDLAAACLDVPPAALDPCAPEVSEVAGELAGLVCADWLRSAHASAPVALDDRNVVDSRMPGAGWLGVRVNGEPFALRLRLASR